MRRRAIFVDQDGALCTGELAGSGPPQLAPGAADAVRRMNRAGWQVVVVCERPEIALGELDEDRLADFHERLRESLLAKDARIDGIYLCPHHPEGTVERLRRVCECRRPGIALYERARDEMGIDLTRSFFIGDSELALRSAIQAGLRPILVRTSTDRETGSRSAGEPCRSAEVVDSFAEAADLVASREMPSEAPAR